MNPDAPNGGSGFGFRLRSGSFPDVAAAAVEVVYGARGGKDGWEDVAMSCPGFTTVQELLVVVGYGMG